MFLLRNSSVDEQDAAFCQIPFSSHLRYLFIELPSFKHVDNDEFCSTCYQNKLLTNILFELLFDFIDLDLCSIQRRSSGRSSLLDDEFFQKIQQNKSFSSHRIQIVLFFIELIELHTNKCSSSEKFQFDHNEYSFFQSIEDAIRDVVQQNSTFVFLFLEPKEKRKFYGFFPFRKYFQEKLSILFSVLELCILSSKDKFSRLHQVEQKQRFRRIDSNFFFSSGREFSRRNL